MFSPSCRLAEQPLYTSGAVNANGRKRSPNIMIIFSSTTNCTRAGGEVDFYQLFYHVRSRWITCDINQHNLENSFSSESQRVVCVACENCLFS